MSHAPIGIFDSGVGGLTVVHAVHERLPQESILYLGDTARVPYGTKSAGTVYRYALNCARFLVDKGAKIIVIACNTASALAMPSLSGKLGIPILGVIEPGATAAAKQSQGHIGVIGTEGTIRSNRYQELIAEQRPDARISALPCPLFVPLAEEGMAQHPVTEMLAREYLQPLLDDGIDTLVLGCTHYPVLTPTLRQVCGDDVAIIDSASAVADHLASLLEREKLRASVRGNDRFFATDVSDRFARVGRIFLREKMGEVGWVDVDAT